MGPLKETLDSGDSEGSMSGARKLEVWKFECLDVWMFGSLDVGMFGDQL